MRHRCSALSHPGSMAQVLALTHVHIALSPHDWTSHFLLSLPFFLQAPLFSSLPDSILPLALGYPPSCQWPWGGPGSSALKVSSGMNMHLGTSRRQARSPIWLYIQIRATVHLRIQLKDMAPLSMTSTTRARTRLPLLHHLTWQQECQGMTHSNTEAGNRTQTLLPWPGSHFHLPCDQLLSGLRMVSSLVLA